MTPGDTGICISQEPATPAVRANTENQETRAQSSVSEDDVQSITMFLTMQSSKIPQSLNHVLLGALAYPSPVDVRHQQHLQYLSTQQHKASKIFQI